MGVELYCACVTVKVHTEHKKGSEHARKHNQQQSVCSAFWFQFWFECFLLTLIFVSLLLLLTGARHACEFILQTRLSIIVRCSSRRISGCIQVLFPTCFVLCLNADKLSFAQQKEMLDTTASTHYTKENDKAQK